MSMFAFLIQSVHGHSLALDIVLLSQPERKRLREREKGREKDREIERVRKTERDRKR